MPHTVARAQRTLCLAAIAFAATGAHAQSSWTRTDVVLASASTALIAMDWAQTLEIARQSDHCAVEGCWREANPVLGPRPSEGRVNTVLTVALVGNLALGRLLPRVPRRVWWVSVVAFEIFAVARNHSMGVRIRI